MNNKEIKNIIDEYINQENNDFSASDLYLLGVNKLNEIHSILGEDYILPSMNHLHGYGRKSLLGVSKIDGKSSPFISGIEYYSSEDIDKCVMIFNLVSDEKLLQRHSKLIVHLNNGKLEYKIVYDKYHNEIEDSYIDKYCKLLIKSFESEIKNRLSSIKDINDEYNVTLNGFDIHNCDKYQVIDNELFRVTYSSSLSETDINVEVELNPNIKVDNREEINRYIRRNRNRILSSIKIDKNQLNGFYKTIYEDIMDEPLTLTLN